MAFEERMAELKKPMEMGDYGTEEARDLEHAIDILGELRQEILDGKHRVGWDKLERATRYLEDLLAKHVGDPEKTEEK